MPDRLPFEQHLVRLVPRLQRAVVEDAGLFQQPHRVQAHGAGRSARAGRFAPGGRGETIDRARQQPRLLRRVVERRDVLVAPAEHAELMPLAFGDLRHHLRVDEIGDAGDEERRRHVVPVEQLEDAREPLRGAEFAARHRDDGRVAARELIGRVADVERQGHGDAGAVRPDLRIERAAGAHVARRPAAAAPRSICVPAAGRAAPAAPPRSGSRRRRCRCRHECDRVAWHPPYWPAVLVMPDCCLIHFAISSAVANQTPGFDFM